MHISNLFCVLISFIFLACNSNQKHPGAVVTGHPEATKIGIKVLEEGGNAVDASIAVQLALAVCFPSAGNLGGGGFMVARMHDGSSYALDFRETAPKRSTTNMYLDQNENIIDSLSTYGPLAVGVPGTIDGIFEAHNKFGKISIDTLFNHAIRLALKGFEITERQANAFNYYQEDFEKFNPNNSYLQALNWQKGDTLRQIDLGKTLTIIRNKGRKGFYEGEIANNIVSTIENQGILSLSDLKEYKSKWRDPITLEFKNYKLISMPPPSSGGIALSQLLIKIFNFSLEDIEHNSTEYIHLLSELEKRVYADRSQHLGDNDFYDVPIHRLLNKKYNQQRASTINFRQATPSDSISAGLFNVNESEETTHFSITDSFGNAVAVTTTLNTSYGSKIFVNNSGFLLNNEMDDFSAKPGSPNTYGLIGSQANSIEPGKRMLSSMTPSILEKNDNLFLVLGSPGGSTIITSVFQTILNVILFDMNIQHAVDNKRFHHQWKPEYIYIEKNLASDSIIKSLQNMGHYIKERNSIGHVNAIMYDKNTISIGVDKRGDNSGEILNN